MDTDVAPMDHQSTGQPHDGVFKVLGRVDPSEAPSGAMIQQLLARLSDIELELGRGNWRSVETGLCRARELLERRMPKQAGTANCRGGLTARQMHQLQCYIEERLATAITLQSLASIAGLSKSHFCRAFRESFAEPPLNYVRARRIEKSKELMLATRLPLTTIGVMCGFADKTALCKTFKRLVGESPLQWRRSRYRQ